jgi:transposase
MSAKTRKKATRNIGALPKHLPRCEQVVEPETTVCPCCQGQLHKIGEDVNEVLDVIPAILRVLRIIRPKYGCRSCTDGVVQAKASPRLIESGMVSTALVAYVLASKFAWYLPLYRQVQILAGLGVHSTARRWPCGSSAPRGGSKASTSCSCEPFTPRRGSSAMRRRCR